MNNNFKNAMREAGLEPPATITSTGTLTRFHIQGDKSRDENGWYVLHDAPPAGAFGCWKRGISGSWAGRPHQTLTAEEKVRYKANIEAQKQQRVAEQEKYRTECRKRAAAIWNDAQPAPPDHEYLTHKGIKPNGTKIHKGRLVVPLRDTAGTLHGLQFIDADGSKRFMTGTVKRANYFTIGGKPSTVLYLAEGFATAATIYEATGEPCACCFDAGNLGPVAKALNSDRVGPAGRGRHD